MNINPFILIRRNPLQKNEIINKKEKQILDYTKKISEKIIQKNESKNKVIKELEKVIQITFNNHILNLKRAVFNENENKIKRIMINSNVQLSKLEREHIKDFIKMQRELTQLKVEFCNLYEESYIESRENLQKIAKMKNIQDYMLMIQPNIYYKLKAYIDEPFKQHKSKVKKLDYTLYNVLVRSALKTSPFNNTTEVGRVELVENTHIENKILNKTKKININHTYLYRILFNVLYKTNSLYEKVTYTLPPLELDSNDKASFLVFTDTPNNDKVFENDEILKKVKLPIEIANLFRKKKCNISFKDFEQATNENYKTEEIKKVIAKFVDIGLLIPEIGLHDSTDDIFITDIKTLCKKYLNKQENDSVELLLNFIIAQKNILKKTSGINERYKFYKKLEEQLNDFHCLSGVNINTHHLYYEDSYIDDVVSYPCNKFISKDNLHHLQMIQKFTLLFDANVRMKFELGEKLKNEGIHNFSSEFYRLLLETSKDVSSYWLNPFYSISKYAQSPVVKLLDSLKFEFLNRMSILDLEKKNSIDITEILREITDRIPNEVIENIDFSSSFFLQKNEDLIIINNIYDGHEKYKARFMNFFQPYLNNDKNYLHFNNLYYNEQNYYEYIENFGFNGNIKPNFLKKQILSNNVGKKRFISDKSKYEELEKLSIGYSNSSGFILKKDGKKIKITFRGSLMPLSMPGYISTILQLFSSGHMTFKFNNLLQNYNHIPRINVGNVVLSREKWKITPYIDSLLKKEEELDVSYFYRINKFFTDTDLPNQFFIIARRSMEEKSQSIINFKPLFIDITNPISVKVFLKEVIHKFNGVELGNFYIEEYLSNNSNNAIEYDVELNKKEGDRFE